ncbi:MAG: hypothetical protein QXI59_06185, partial [Candidatus Bathyarchaeia archaeon]
SYVVFHLTIRSLIGGAVQVRVIYQAESSITLSRLSSIWHREYDGVLLRIGNLKVADVLASVVSVTVPIPVYSTMQIRWVN